MNVIERILLKRRLNEIDRELSAIERKLVYFNEPIEASYLIERKYDLIEIREKAAKELEEA